MLGAPGPMPGVPTGPNPGMPMGPGQPMPGGRLPGPMGQLPGAPNALMLSRVLALGSIIVLALGLFIPENSKSVFSQAIAWSLFALVCAVLIVLGAVGAGPGPNARLTWQLGAVGAAGLTGYWLLLILPAISSASNVGFAITLAVAAGGAAMWVHPARNAGAR